MRRVVLALCLVLPCSGLPAHSTARQDVQDSVLIATDNSPGTARIEYALSGTNGILGYVFPLTVRSGKFTLKVLDDPTSLTQFGITFYGAITSLDPNDPSQTNWIVGTTPSVTYCDNTAPTCSDWIPAGAAWAIVTLAFGANGHFEYTATA
ncbi:MAG: hypothetical protein ACYDCC_05150 [Actinomycetota bacterium]